VEYAVPNKTNVKDETKKIEIYTTQPKAQKKTNQFQKKMWKT